MASQPTSVTSSFTCVSSSDQGGSCFVASCAQLRAPRCRPGYRTSRCTATSPRRNESLVFLRTATRRPSRQRGTAVITMDRSIVRVPLYVSLARILPQPSTSTSFCDENERSLPKFLSSIARRGAFNQYSSASCRANTSAAALLFADLKRQHLGIEYGYVRKRKDCEGA